MVIRYPGSHYQGFFLCIEYKYSKNDTIFFLSYSLMSNKNGNPTTKKMSFPFVF